LEDAVRLVRAVELEWSIVRLNGDVVVMFWNREPEIPTDIWSPVTEIW